ncbi:hypothetical protein RRG08_063233 [Elysia crispata]|uniref:Uncharacterized protein n=1 Tax=Elysia crispata TaxID=231223 RepID=A0AAE0Y9F4_9GAST|nr:hypothetical protein RRG08_063233 [Elysia crispata]
MVNIFPITDLTYGQGCGYQKSVLMVMASVATHAQSLATRAMKSSAYKGTELSSSPRQFGQMESYRSCLETRVLSKRNMNGNGNYCSSVQQLQLKRYSYVQLEVINRASSFLYIEKLDLSLKHHIHRNRHTTRN